MPDAAGTFKKSAEIQSRDQQRQMGMFKLVFGHGYPSTGNASLGRERRDRSAPNSMKWVASNGTQFHDNSRNHYTMKRKRMQFKISKRRESKILGQKGQCIYSYGIIGS